MKKRIPKLKLSIYGIWSKEDNKIIFISLNIDNVELTYDMEGYSDESHVIVCLDAIYDASNLARLNR